jgi:eukaryotic-like serine/threonine-protein kinase
MIGERVGSYHVISELGAGPVGSVYLAEGIGKRVAIKVLRGGGSRERLDRALADARSASALRHPGIVEVLEWGVQPSGDGYVATEYFEGSSLREHLASGAVFSPEELRLVTRQIALALGVGHNRRITHGSLKPENVFIPGGHLDRVKISDYGMARLVPELPGGLGAIGGAAAYLSPERCRGAGVVDVNDDVYSLGCLMFEMVCGRVPFPHTDAAALMAAHHGAPLPPPRSLRPELPENLDALILDMLARAPGDRPLSMRTVVERLGDHAEAVVRPVRPRPVSPRFTPLGHAHIRPTEERLIPTIPARGRDPRHTPLGGAHLHLRDIVVEDVPRATTGIAGVQEGPAPAPAAVPPRRLGRRAWMIFGALAAAAAAGATARALRSSKSK